MRAAYRTLFLLFLVSYCKRDFYQGSARGIISKLALPKSVAPYGMRFVPAGRFIAGPYDDTVAEGIPVKRTEQCVEAFYMDSHPITNGQYLQYIHDLMERKGETIRRQGRSIAITDQYIAAQMPNPGVWKAYPMAAAYEHDYFGTAMYFDYPVVGVTWDQANAFCEWSSEQLAAYNLEKNRWPLPAFRLPTSTEYEYAARGGKVGERYAWGSKGLRDPKGALMANFRLSETDTLTRGYLFTSPVGTFPKNDFGLHDMTGNVQHWCADAYRGTQSDLYDADQDKKSSEKIIKGCSWNHPAYFTDPGVSCWAPKDSTLATLGFRRVMAAPQRQ